MLIAVVESIGIFLIICILLNYISYKLKVKRTYSTLSALFYSIIIFFAIHYSLQWIIEKATGYQFGSAYEALPSAIWQLGCTIVTYIPTQLAVNALTKKLGWIYIPPDEEKKTETTDTDSPTKE